MPVDPGKRKKSGPKSQRASVRNRRLTTRTCCGDGRRNHAVMPNTPATRALKRNCSIQSAASCAAAEGPAGGKVNHLSNAWLVVGGGWPTHAASCSGCNSQKCIFYEIAFETRRRIRRRAATKICQCGGTVAREREKKAMRLDAAFPFC